MAPDTSPAPSGTKVNEKGTFESPLSSCYDSIQHDAEMPPSPGAEHGYDAAAIRAEFDTYRAVLPKPDVLLQKRLSAELLRALIERHNNLHLSHPNKQVVMPRFLRLPHEGGIKPHNALCCLLLDGFQSGTFTKKKDSGFQLLASWLVRLFSFGHLYRQLHIPADFIADQFIRVAEVIPHTVAELVDPDELRLTIRSAGLPVPNFFLDPEDPRQFPPHIALLVMLQAAAPESEHLHSTVTRAAWMAFSFIALFLRLVLEVIGGAGAVWGGSEVFYLRTEHNVQFWRSASISVGVFAFCRFVILNAPQEEDEGDILGPAGPWSLHPAARLRSVFNHPVHYFARGQAPYRASTTNKDK